MDREEIIVGWLTLMIPTVTIDLAIGTFLGSTQLHGLKIYRELQLLKPDCIFVSHLEKS